MTAGQDVVDAVVVGGGVIGCATAVELARRGVKVVLLERQTLASGASGAAAGMLAPQSEAHGPGPWFDLLRMARDGYAAVAAELQAETGLDVEYRRCGVLRVALDEGERCDLREMAAWQRTLGLCAEWLDPAEAREYEPNLTPNAAGALWLPDEGQVRSARLVVALGRLAGRLGAEIHEGEPAIELRSAGRVTEVVTPLRSIACAQVVVAGGVWIPQIETFRQVPVAPVKGQMVSGLAGVQAAPRTIVWGRGAYVIPKVGGDVFVGATEEQGFDPRPTLGGIAGLIERGSAIVPGLGSMTLVSAWAGLRPATPDRLPILGAYPGVEGLWLASGHYRNGILLGPLTGKLMAQLVTGQRPDADVSPYTAARFHARADVEPAA